MDWICVKDKLPEQDDARWMLCWYQPFNSCARTFWSGTDFYAHNDLEKNCFRRIQSNRTRIY